MAILGSRMSNRGNMNSSPSFHEFRRQASFFLKEKIKTARLALTDVTSAQLLAEEATNGNPVGPDARTLKIISRAAFEVDDYWRIVGILHKRLVKFDKRNWRVSYKALIVLEHLLTHGPGSVSEEFQPDRDVIGEMEKFQYVDEKGFNWGLKVRQKSERILKLIEKGPLLKEERAKARKISRGIQGFGSFSHRTPSGQEILQEASPLKAFDRCNSQFTDHSTDQDVLFSVPKENGTIITNTEKPLLSVMPESENTAPGNFNISKENLAPDEGVLARKAHEASWSSMGESSSLLGKQEGPLRINLPLEDHHHPFDDEEHSSVISLL